MSKSMKVFFIILGSVVLVFLVLAGIYVAKIENEKMANRLANDLKKYSTTNKTSYGTTAKVCCR